MMGDNQTCGRVEPVRSRRELLQKSSFGFGAIALGSLLERDGAQAAVRSGQGVSPFRAKLPHTRGHAKSVIFIFLRGGPSHIDTFDPKPALQRLDGQPLPDSFNASGLNLQFIKASEAKLLGSRRTFRKWGQSGLEVSDLFSHLAQRVDDLAIIRSCYHDSFVHSPAMCLMHTGSVRLGHPSVGSWVTYGLGTESDNLPAYIVMTEQQLKTSKTFISAGFLPAAYQGTMVSTHGTFLTDLAPPPQIGVAKQRLLLNQVKQWNERHLQFRRDDTDLAARIENYELAFRMQMAGPELNDLSSESESTRTMYGMDQKTTATFGRMCLMARRMVERGVRFVHLFGTGWDGHNECDKEHQNAARVIDQPIAAMLADLKQRGLLESTLVVCTGEFGRTPVMQGKRGRDHNPYGFTVWMAGGGIRGGKVIGATDEFGFTAVEDKVHVSDLHATMLGLLGLDHERLTYRFRSRDQRLTDIGGHNNLTERLTG